MPALLMHIQAADHIHKAGLIPDMLQNQVETYPWAYRLGAVLVDLPLFDHFWLKLGLFFLRRPYPESTWATAIHSRGSASLAAALLGQAHAKRSLSGTEKKKSEILEALVAGLLTHLAFDRSMHPPIEEAVRAHLRPDESHSQLHEALENYQSLVWHQKNRGCTGIGTKLLREGVTVGPKRHPQMPKWLATTFRAGLDSAYRQAPTEALLQRWCSGMCAYRDLLSTRLASISIRSSYKFLKNRPWAQEVELENAWLRGVELSRNYLVAAASERQTGSSVFIDVIGDGPLV